MTISDLDYEQSLHCQDIKTPLVQGGSTIVADAKGTASGNLFSKAVVVTFTFVATGSFSR